MLLFPGGQIGEIWESSISNVVSEGGAQVIREIYLLFIGLKK